MNIVIVEDEKAAARMLSRKLEKMGYTVQETLASVAESVKWFESNPHPDLIFLDIQLADGLSFEIFDQLVIKSAVIFTTAYDEYALKAFKLNSVDYLLKPIDGDDLEHAIAKFKERNVPQAVPLDIISELMRRQTVKTYKERFTIKVGNTLKILKVQDFEFVFSENKASYVQTNEQRAYVMDQSLEQLEQELDPSEFYRINRKYIIQRSAIKEINLYSNSRLKVVLHQFTPDDLIVSREKVTDFKQWL